MPSSSKTTAKSTAKKKPAARPSVATPNTQAQEAPAHASATRELQINANAETALSAEMKAFNRALARIDKLKAQITELNHLGEQYQQKNHEVLTPLMTKITEQQRAMALLLDEYLTTPPKTKKPPLTKTQRETAVKLVCDLSAHLAKNGDPTMSEIHDRHNKVNLEDIAKAEHAELQAMMQAMLEQIGGNMPERQGDDDEPLSPEAMLHHTMTEMARLREEEQARRDARAAKRQAKKTKTKPDSPQTQAIQNKEQAEQTLKAMFRQIASRLHPDREPDEAERQRKTALMSEANAAYGRKDLVALMKIQLQAELVDANHASRLSAQRLTDLTLLLKQQAATLDAERQMLQAKWTDLLDVPWGYSLTANALDAVLHARRVDLEAEIAQKADDLAFIQEESGLKEFLNQQRRTMREQEKHQHNNLF